MGWSTMRKELQLRFAYYLSGIVGGFGFGFLIENWLKIPLH